MKDLILLIGAAGAGKGSLADILQKEGYKKLTMSNILRKYNVPIPRVGLVDDETVIATLKKALDDSSQKVVLDGFPRTPEQACALVDSGIKINRAVVLEADFSILANRILDRIVCPKCGASYTEKGDFKKPINEGLCDKCNVALTRRAEDNVEDLKKRFSEYKGHEKNILHVLNSHNVKIVTIKVSDGYSVKEILR